MRVLSFGGHYDETGTVWVGPPEGLEIIALSSGAVEVWFLRQNGNFRCWDLTAEEAESLREFLKPVPIAPLAEDLTESLGYHGPRARDLK